MWRNEEEKNNEMKSIKQRLEGQLAEEKKEEQAVADEALN